jgi:hypothetical protein
MVKLVLIMIVMTLTTTKIVKIQSKDNEEDLSGPDAVFTAYSDGDD